MTELCSETYNKQRRPDRMQRHWVILFRCNGIKEHMALKRILLGWIMEDTFPHILRIRSRYYKNNQWKHRKDQEHKRAIHVDINDERWFLGRSPHHLFQTFGIWINDHSKHHVFFFQLIYPPTQDNSTKTIFWENVY